MAAQPTDTATLTGAILSRRWRVGPKLGEGGMGEVYAAEPVAGGARVAIKVLRSEFVNDPAVLARFLEEGRTCAALIHPNIVRVFECGQAEDRCPYIVMELLEGVPLAAYTANGGRVPVGQAVPILQGILAGLAAAHAQGVVHRDLKPDNVYLTRDRDGTFVVKLLDFGLAKVMDVAGGMGNRTRSGVLLGTPAYMSPEQVRNARDVDPRADVWSAGVLFYEMITGRPAFPAPTEFARLTAVMTVEPEPLDATLAPLAPFVARALKKNRDERFSSALEMARALASLAQGGGPQALSRLPEVHSLLAPSAPDVGSTMPSRAVPSLGLPAAPARAAGDTLTSPIGRPVSDPPPRVVLVEPRTGATLPSEDLPILERGRAVRRGIAPGLVASLVVGALVAGFLLGWASARM